MKTILIIDDDDQLRKSFEKLLTEEGYRIQTAASGEAGISAISRDLPDLVVLDVRLPGMNGLETLKAIQKIEGRLPVIIMTAYATTDTAIKATKLGAFDYVVKPFDIPKMLTVIKQALETGYFMRSKINLVHFIYNHRILCSGFVSCLRRLKTVFFSISILFPFFSTKQILLLTGGAELLFRG